MTVGDKAVAVVLLGHDDGSGSSAAYSVRGQAKTGAGDPAGADQDLEKAENIRTQRSQWSSRPVIERRVHQSPEGPSDLP